MSVGEQETCITVRVGKSQEPQDVPERRGAEAGPRGEATPEKPPARGLYFAGSDRDLGILGEEVAVQFLTDNGYVVLERNYRTPFGEADIIFRDGEEVVLAEVKTRLGEEPRPEEAVDRKKVRRYRSITLSYLASNEWADQVRFDVIGVNILSAVEAEVHHFAGVCLWEN